jgi:hypothetical protein
MITRLKRVVCLLALALLLTDHASADQYPHLLEITSANFSDSLTVISKDYDWVLMEFYAHWSVFILSYFTNVILFSLSTSPRHQRSNTNTSALKTILSYLFLRFPPSSFAI